MAARHLRDLLVLALLDGVDKAVDILGQQLGIADQRGRAGIIALRDGAARLALELARMIGQLVHILAFTGRGIRSHAGEVSPIAPLCASLNPYASGRRAGNPTP
ncbi:hypothetical protein [Erythrobacter tepidarius]|uniref:hypothetical protein n=1 Tax=Erythrobacter tepidarius TaxID=60454 RepID=UPI000A39AA0F|nr:hypothetical protein [Erythrobacter tepidarius]